ncbi:uncharacterized protein [Chanodichthys erythropterus]|uniref:uncharacterized protein n=1 Tax=Chanodichthys erythropterus TaxID=933992 RepID=UPI00351F4DE9
MESVLYKKYQDTLSSWCKGEELDPAHAILIAGVAEDVSISQIEELMQTVRCWGRVRVRGRTYSVEAGGLLVLCECKEEIKPQIVPPEVRSDDGTIVWHIVVVDPRPDSSDASEDFVGKLQSFLQAEGKTIADLQDYVATSAPAKGTEEFFIHAMAEVMKQSNRGMAESHSYRRLRVFSGITPTPMGEEQVEYWLEQATVMVEGSDCPEKEKRRRIIESLRGPALEIVRSLRFSNPEASSDEYISAIDRAFGSPETGEDLYFAYRLIQQKSGEMLSDYVQRLEPFLAKVVRKGGVRAQDMNRVRIEQLLRGAVGADIMLLQLRLKEKRANPPTFLELLSQIRVEEEHERSRRKVHARVRSVEAQDCVSATDFDLQELRADVKALQAKMSELKVKSNPVSKESVSTKVQARQCTSDDKAIGASELQKKVDRLSQKVKTLESREPAQPASASAVKAKVSDSGSKKPLSQQEDDFFCYRCGEDGHISTKCTATQNEKKVIRRLIASLRKAKEKQSSSEVSSDKKTTHCSARTQMVQNIASVAIPTGLVGPISTVTLKVNGNPCTALLDSGSQVTIVFEKWYQEHLSHIPIQPVSGLAIWGLSDESYPYQGYIVVDVQFPKELTGTLETLSVLALVCPGPNTPVQTPVILGTNASLFQRLFALCDKEKGSNLVHVFNIKSFLPVSLPESTVFKASQRGEDDIVGRLKWKGPGSVTIPPEDICCVSCQAEFSQPVTKGIVLVEADEVTPLPQGLMVQPMVALASAVNGDNFSVLVQNETKREVIIPEGALLGNVQVADMAVPPARVSKSEEIDPSLFDFGDSPIPVEWKERLRQKLMQKRNVFSLHEWEVGLAKGVEHCIRLSDTRPFRERSRRIAPADIEDVRRHLKDLLEAGIIKESRSPYASPIVIVRKKSGKIRMCIDYRTLNSKTIPDQYTTPRIDDALDCLAGSRWFSVLDL